MSKSNGKLFEKALIGELLQQGFYISKQDAALDHDAKLDFVIQRFPGSIMHHQVGIQLTVGEHNNVKKMQEFLAVHSGRYQKGVQRSVYIQADRDLDLDGGAYVIGSAITQFQFDRRFVNQRVMGVEVGEDLSYGLFALEERIKEAAAEQGSVQKPAAVQSPDKNNPPSQAKPQSDQKPVASKTLTGPAALEGKLTYWIPEELGYGYVLGQDNETYYLHFNAIADDKLRSLLGSLQQRSRYPIQESIEFEAGQKKSPSDNYRPAKNVRLATGKPFLASL